MSTPTREELVQQQQTAVDAIIVRMRENYTPDMVRVALAQAYTAGYIAGLDATKAIFAPTEKD